MSTGIVRREGFKHLSHGVLSSGGMERWNAGSVRSILSNEKYRGDALLQKSYTVDFLTKKKKANAGEIPQFYVKNNHPAIIASEAFEMVQRELERRGKAGAVTAVFTYSLGGYSVASAATGTAPRSGTPPASIAAPFGAAITSSQMTKSAQRRT